MRMKRALDLVLALIALVGLGPVVAAAAAVILAVDGRPVFFSQYRSGLNGRQFALRKFRTMSTESEDPATDAARITALGAILRRTSVDELPTLWSVVRGDMSLVGPRPLPVRYLDRYTSDQRRRLEVPPGITGLAQIHGRNLLSWEDRFALDVEYVDGRSFLGDVKILIQTVLRVLQRQGIEAQENVTMPEFQGGPSGQARSGE